MVASKQVEFPLYRGIGRQRERGFVALAQIIGRAAYPFLIQYVVLTSKHVGAALLQFAARETAEVVSSGKNFRAAAKSVGRRTLRKQLDSGSRETTASRVIPTKSAKQTSGRDLFTNKSHRLFQAIFRNNLL